jgi:cysteine synthase
MCTEPDLLPTPLLDLSSLLPDPDQGRLLAKAEFANPTGSIKDRIADALLKGARDEGRLDPGGPVVVPSSGNTAAALAAACLSAGHTCTVVTNGKCSEEKKAMARFYGARVVVVEGSYQDAAQEMAARNGACLIDQYDHPANARSYGGFAREILDQAPQITHFVAGASTGGTISGTGRELKRLRDEAVEVVLADPVGSALSDYVESGELGDYTAFQVEGVGKGSVSGNLDRSLIDQVVEVSDDQAFAAVRAVAQKTRWCIGGSSGLNVHAALQLSAPGRTVVTVLPDHGLKYVTKFEELGVA